MTSEIEKAQLGAETVNIFLNQFGNEPFLGILLEILLEELMNAKVISILSEQEQEGDQVNNNIKRSINSIGSNKEPKET